MTTTPTMRQPSQRALATASLTKALRLDGDAQRKALREHADRYLMTTKTCTLVSRATRFSNP